ncbi:adenylyltransferase and sulfurtransferase [Pseudohyphozyma bogoriensis]|nr:adenylyltransferase and sulfurtransferase [Pseudohyphozyma bogoriensis]
MDLILPAVGLPGQLKLKSASILVVGAGGLGCPVLLYLAAAGVGRITILDHDAVDMSNLHRQVLHTEDRVGMNKAESAARGLTALNSSISIIPLPYSFTPSLFSSPSSHLTPLRTGTYTLILDCTDNPTTRHFLNSYAVHFGIPLVSGGEKEGGKEREWRVVPIELVRNGSAEAQERRVVDVRSETEFGICKIEGSLNIPFRSILRDPALAFGPSTSSTTSPLLRNNGSASSSSSAAAATTPRPKEIVFVCRRGNDSLLAARALERYLEKERELKGVDGMEEEEEERVKVGDLRGGLVAWSRVVEGFPVY